MADLFNNQEPQVVETPQTEIAPTLETIAAQTAIGTPETPTTENTQVETPTAAVEATETKVVKDIFGNNLTEILEIEPEDNTPPEVKQALSLAKEIEEDEFLKGALAAKKLGVSFEEYVSQTFVKDYSEQDAERTFKDYTKKNFPEMSAEDLQYEYEVWSNNSEELSATQKLTIRTWASELNKDIKRPDWKAPQRDIEGDIKKEQENLTKYVETTKGLKIMADAKGEGGFEFTDKQIQKGLQLKDAFSRGKGVTNSDGTTHKQFLDMCTVYANLTDILGTIAKQSTESGEISVLAQRANLSTSSQPTNVPPTMSGKGYQNQREFFLATQKAIEAEKAKNNK